jgi:hypothetical protein
MLSAIILAAILHIAPGGDYNLVSPSGPAVVCGASTVPVYDGASGAVVCESGSTVLGAQTVYQPVPVGYGGYFGGYPASLSPWAGSYSVPGYGLGGFGGRFGGGFGGHWGHGHDGGTCTPVAPATSCTVR